MSSSGGSSAPRIQVFRPTMEEFKNFSGYIEKIESFGAHKAGLAKIIPPDGWIPRKRGYDDIELVIPAPISQVVTGRQGLYQQINIQQKSVTVKDFKKLAESSKYMTPTHFDYEDLERKYWRNITYNSPIYGADVSGSLYDDGVDEFNIQHLNTILDMVKEDYEIQIEGVNTAYLYFGMWKTTFAWHTEDMDLYSINYLHFGAPKTWYVVPPEHGRRLERLAAGFFHGSHQSCAAFLRHKMTIISPHILKQYSIPYSKITQEPGEFMITFPFGYHSGFNHGYNCAESTNFALPRWVEYGKRTTNCTCRNDCVKICMDMFVKKFQPDLYEVWKAGKDYGTHPEDPSKHFAAPPPKKFELALSAQREERRKAQKIEQATQKIKRHPISKVDKKEFSKIPRESDEDTESYDAIEIASPKRKQAKKSTIKAEELDEEENMSVETNPESSEFNTKLENKDEIEQEEEKHSDTHVSDKEVKTEQEVQSIIKPSELDLPANRLDNTDSPPQLKPFWDSPEKFQSDINSSGTGVNPSYGEHLVLLNKFPHLRDAISSGAFSVVPISSKGDSESEGCSKSSEIPKESSTGLIQTWRCEQTNNGLKIKFVQPKKTNQAMESLPKSSVKDTPNIVEKPEESPPDPSDGNSSITKTPAKKNSYQRKAKKYVKKAATRSPGSGSDSSPGGSQNNSKVHRADGSQDSWARPLQGIWQHQPHNFQAEVEFNEKLSSITPHCAICVLFTPMYNNNTFPSEPSYVPSFSSVRMPAYCYGNSLNSECMLDTSSLLRSDGTAPLLVCSVCKVCVHATCYGVSMLPIGLWTCTRCSKQAEEAECCLCVMRGGALKPTTDNRWAHIMCAILITETYFESTLQKQPINVTKIPTSRQRLKCKYCVKTSRGICVQCQSGKCYLPYHVTCGFMAGVIFETSDWPEPINMICTRHIAKRRKPPKRQLTNVSVGERVIAKHKNNRRYYWANVKNKCIQEYYSILFEDNSHSTNTLPEDIVSRNVAIHGPPQMNEKVQVKWTDDKIYNGTFKGSQSSELYVIEFDDGSVQHMERKQIYAADEELPKEIQSKLSHYSDGGNYDFYSNPPEKRIRISNQKYS